MTHRMRGKYVGISDSENGSHIVRRVGDLYFKQTNPHVPVNPGMERALYGLYHLMFGDNEALAQASLIALEDIPVQRATNAKDQERVERAIRVESLLEKPTVDFLQRVIGALYMQEEEAHGLSLIKAILGDEAFQLFLSCERKSHLQH